MKFTKVQKGWYATEDGHWAVVTDGIGYVSQAQREGDGLLCGVTGNEWAAVFDPKGRLREDHKAGDNLDWFDTKREAVAHCEWSKSKG